MRIDSKVVNSTLYIGLSGELDEYASESARNTLDGLMQENTAKRVVIDLSDLSFMDSTGIGVLIGRFKKLKALEIPVFIANPSRHVDRILTISGIYNIMPKIS